MKKSEKTGLSAYRAVLAPYSIWSLLFVIVPLAFVAYYAFTDNNFQFTTEHITRFFTATSSLVQDDGSSREVHTYLLIFWRSLKLALISTAICLLMGYPIAYIMARAKEKTQKTMMTLIMIPMWMNFLIRTYAWMTILQDTGIINGVLGAIGIEPIHVIGTETAVIIGMVYDYFPYMVLPIYSILAKLDIRLLEAARDLGCNGASVLRRVVFPLSVPGVISGVTAYGLYVELPSTIEGLVHVNSLDDDYYIFREDAYELVGEHTGKTYKLGQQVRIRVTGADELARTIDFELAEQGER